MIIRVLVKIDDFFLQSEMCSFSDHKDFNCWCSLLLLCMPSWDSVKGNLVVCDGYSNVVM